MALQTKSKDIIDSGIRDKTAFVAASVKGCEFSYPRMVSTGILPEDYARRLKSAEGPVYVIFSYATPIAWFDGTSWIIPDVKYSNTTTNHQSVVHVAIERHHGKTDRI